MGTNITLLWYITMAVALGFLFGFAIGIAVGISKGKQQSMRQMQLSQLREKLGLDIDKFLKSKDSKSIKKNSFNTKHNG